MEWTPVESWLKKLKSGQQEVDGKRQRSGDEMETDKERKVFIIKESGWGEMIGWEHKIDEEGKKYERIINDRSYRDQRSSSNQCCHGNLSFLCTDWRTQDGGKRKPYF